MVCEKNTSQNLHDQVTLRHFLLFFQWPLTLLDNLGVPDTTSSISCLPSLSHLWDVFPPLKGSRDETSQNQGSSQYLM